jgi:hypothetical protein
MERKYEPPITDATKGMPVKTNLPFLDFAN